MKTTDASLEAEGEPPGWPIILQVVKTFGNPAAIYSVKFCKIGNEIRKIVRKKNKHVQRNISKRGKQNSKRFNSYS